MSSAIEVLKNYCWSGLDKKTKQALSEALLALEQKDKGCPKCGNKIKLGLYCNRCYQLGRIEARKQGALLFADKIIELVRSMPNADDRYNKLCKGAIPQMLDGGSVHRFTLIEEIEKLKELEVEKE